MTPVVQAIVKLLTAKETVTFIVKGVRMGLKIGSLIKFISVVQAVQSEVSKLISDGDFTPDEAEAEAAKLLSGEDLKVKVSGDDVLDELEAFGVCPLKIVEEQHQGMLFAGEDTQEATEQALETSLGLAERKLRDGGLLADQHRQRGNQLGEQGAVRPESGE